MQKHPPFVRSCSGLSIVFHTECDLTTSRFLFSPEPALHNFADAFLGARVAPLLGFAFPNAPLAERVEQTKAASLLGVLVDMGFAPDCIAIRFAEPNMNGAC